METGTEKLRLILGLKVRSLRQDRGLTLQQVAATAGLSVSYLSEIEKGKKYPKPDKLLRLAAALGSGYDELVSMRVEPRLAPLREIFTSAFFEEFPFEFFGLEPEDLFHVISEAPDKAGALVRTLVEIGKTYDLQVEHFLLAALRSYQQKHANYFDELETAAEEFRREQGWPPGAPVSPVALRAILEARHHYAVDETTLSGHPLLGGLRSVFDAGPPPRLFLNSRLLPVQQAFVLGRELGFRELRLTERAPTSSWLQIRSFEELLNNFRASYFSGALLMDRGSLGPELRGFFARESWDGEALVALMRRYDATPEMFFYRLTELAPRILDLEELYFLRFHSLRGSDAFDLTKVFNLSRVPVPHGVALKEHYCRRWPDIGLHRRLVAASGRRRGPADLVTTAQRCRFVEDGAEFFVLAMARPLLLDPEAVSSVSIGFLVNDAFRRSVGFWDDPAVPRLDVGLTCERCRLAPEECRDRAAPPEIWERQQAQAVKVRAVGELVAGKAGT